MAEPTDVNRETTEAAVERPVASGAHPLIWAAVILWLTVEAIGEGLVALVTLLSSVNLTTMDTSTDTAATDTTADSVPTPTPTPS
jgi:hypothetical protein